MKAILVVCAFGLALAGCGRGARHQDFPPVSIVSGGDDSRLSSAMVDELAANPAALDDAHRRCKARAPDATPELCAAAAEATRQRFLAPADAYVPPTVHPLADNGR